MITEIMQDLPKWMKSIMHGKLLCKYKMLFPLNFLKNMWLFNAKFIMLPSGDRNIRCLICDNCSTKDRRGNNRDRFF